MQRFTSLSCECFRWSAAIIFVNETSQTAAARVDLELHSLLPATKNKEWPVQYVGQDVRVCVRACV